MSTSAIKKYVIGYLIATVFFFVFQLIYEHFSHDVTSNYMQLAFLIPLAGGIITGLSFIGRETKGKYLFRQLIIGATAWLTLGSVFEGVLEIYGTTNQMIIVFFFVGILQLLAAFVALFIREKPEQVGD